MKERYKIVSGASTPETPDRRELADWLAKDGQLLIPLVELLEKGERAIDEVIDVMGRATIEAVLRMSAEQVAGPKEQGRRDADRELYWHGVQAGRVALKERQLRVDKPRLRKKRPRADEPGEVEVPAYTALQADQPLADRMLEVVLQGVSTRKYETVLPALADQVGVSKSEVSRETIEAGTRILKELAERALGELDVLVVYLDGIVFGDYHVLAAVGVDADGRKHVLGLCGGASENTEITAGLLEDLVARGLRADRRRLFVIDGAKALRQAIGRVFGVVAGQPRDLQAEEDADVSERDLRGHAGEAAPSLRRRTGQAQVLVDHRDLIGAPPELARPFGQVVLSPGRFAMVLDLGSGGLPHVDDRGAAQVGGLDFRVTHRRAPFLRAVAAAPPGRSALPARRTRRCGARPPASPTRSVRGAGSSGSRGSVACSSSVSMRRRRASTIVRVCNNSVMPARRGAVPALRSFGPVDVASVQAIGVNRRLPSGNTNRSRCTPCRYIRLRTARRRPLNG